MKVRDLVFGQEPAQAVVFPEIESEPIVLGNFYEATLQIGNDKPQEKRLFMPFVIAPNFFVNDGDSDDHFCRLIGRKSSDGILTAFPATEKATINPILLVLYCTPMGGYGMTPMNVFKWYGKEKIRLTNLMVCEEALNVFKKCPFYGDVGMAVGGHYIGREVDGMEVFQSVI